MVDSVKNCFEKTLSKLWPRLDLWVSAKSGKVNFEFLTIPIRRKYLQISGVIENKSMFVQCIFFGAAAPGGHQGLRKEGALPGSKRT